MEGGEGEGRLILMCRWNRAADRLRPALSLLIPFQRDQMCTRRLLNGKMESKLHVTLGLMMNTGKTEVIVG